MQKQFIDIGANLCDSRYEKYGDLRQVLYRCAVKGTNALILTNGCVNDYYDTLKIFERFGNPENAFGVKLYTTLGIHPTRSKTLNNHTRKQIEDAYLDPMNSHYKFVWAHVKAYGEFGLDYDRLHFSNKETQLEAFEWQLQLLQRIHQHQRDLCKPDTEPNYLPMFLHCRNAAEDFYPILKKYMNANPTFRGVVHSFTGAIEELNEILKNNKLMVSLNGVGFREQANIDVAKCVPLSKLLLETDAPYCDFRSTHASWPFIRPEAKAFLYRALNDQAYMRTLDPDMESTWGITVKGRNEPYTINTVAEVYAAVTTDPNVSNIKNADERVLAVCAKVKENTEKMFNL